MKITSHGDRVFIDITRREAILLKGAIWSLTRLTQGPDNGRGPVANSRWRLSRLYGELTKLTGDRTDQQ